MSWNAREMTLLACLFILACCWIVPAQAQTSGPGASGLNLTSVKVKEKRISGYGRSVRAYPPKINPTLGRGTGDRTDSPEVASLKEIRDDRFQRQRDLRALDRQSTNSTRSRPSRVYFGYEIRAGITNEGLKPITKLVLAYRPRRNSQVMLEKNFYCHLLIEPGRSRNLKVWFPVKVVDAAFTDPQQSSLSDVVIEQVEYGDGTTWLRPGWNAATFSAEATQQVKAGKCIGL
ncbi:MAG TPA: hypothetical protein VIT88_03245 [Pyrinomonadaceae bacterium]